MINIAQVRALRPTSRSGCVTSESRECQLTAFVVWMVLCADDASGAFEPVQVNTCEVEAHSVCAREFHCVDNRNHEHGSARHCDRARQCPGLPFGILEGA